MTEEFKAELVRSMQAWTGLDVEMIKRSRDGFRVFIVCGCADAILRQHSDPVLARAVGDVLADTLGVPDEWAKVVRGTEAAIRDGVLTVLGMSAAGRSGPAN